MSPVCVNFEFPPTWLMYIFICNFPQKKKAEFFFPFKNKDTHYIYKMTKQRRTETFNVPLAKKLLRDYKDQLKDYDVIALERLFRARQGWNFTPLYHQGGDTLDGRNVCERGLCMFSRKTRNTLSYQFYYDIDMMNASWTWVRALLKFHDMDIPAVNRYCDNREELLSHYMKQNNCDRHTAKQFYTKRLFKAQDDFLIKLAKKYKGDPVYEEKKKLPNGKGKFLAYLYHKWEWDNLSKIMEYFEKNHIKCFADLHDGFYVEKFHEVENIQKIIDEVAEKFGIKMALKPMDDLLDIPKEYIENFKQANCEDDKKEYLYYRDRFEDQYGVHKVIQADKFLLETQQDGYYLVNRSSLVSMFEDWKEAGSRTFDIFGEGKNPKRFIFNYLLDPEKRIVDRLDFHPNLNTVPSDIYNLFTGFFITTISDDFTDKDYQDYEIIKSHIRFIVDDGSDLVDDCENYLQDWVAQFFIHPDVKSQTMLINKGGEGVGKNLLTNAVGTMIGEKYYYETGSPESDLFHNFNAIGKNRLLINIDEGEGKATAPIYERLKNRITSERMTCKEKYISDMVLKDYTRYWLTTNNEAVMKISDTNRRFVAFECAHPAKDDIITKTVPAFLNNKALKLWYNDLMKRDIKNKVWKEFPKTKYYKRCLESSIPTTWLFIEHLFNSEYVFEKYKHNSKMSCRDMFQHYEAYCSSIRYIPIKKQEFENEMSATQLFNKVVTNKGRYMIFNRDAVIDKLKAMGLYEEQLFLDD